jgi:hypothetical protein
MHRRVSYPPQKVSIGNTCFGCHRTFLPTPTTELFCSLDCHRSWLRLPSNNRHNRICFYCGASAPTKRNLTIPHAWGGEHETVHCCTSCNSHLGAHSDIEGQLSFEGRLLRLARRLETEFGIVRNFPNYSDAGARASEGPHIARLRHLSQLYLSYIRGERA